MNFTDTILALSSPAASATGLRAIVRLSGPHAHRLAGMVTDMSKFSAGVRGCFQKLPLNFLPPNQLATLLLFASPRSFTGEDVAELHVPNSPPILRALSERLLAHASANAWPARLAEPGEFSARAFLNRKIDLTQAEGIAATINAANESQLRAAASLRQGDLHHWIDRHAEQLANLLALTEAGIDFVDEEDIHFLAPQMLADELAQLDASLTRLLTHAARGDRPDALPAVVFIGMPNVGKSSLVNVLAAHDRSIVSPIAGTTRDAVAAVMKSPLGDIRLIDVPGEEPPTDELRDKMMQARRRAILDADLIIEVIDSEVAAQEPRDSLAVVVHNKSDLLPSGLLPPAHVWQRVSAKTGQHIDELRRHIAQSVHQARPISADIPALNQRHRELLGLARGHIQAAGAHAQRPELLAAELRLALDQLGQITGAISPDEIIGRIFSQFCIGK